MSNRLVKWRLAGFVVMLPAFGCTRLNTSEGEARMQKELDQARTGLSNLTAELKMVQAALAESGKWQTSTRKADELKWAKEVGDYFLQCVANRELEEADSNPTEYRKEGKKGTFIFSA